jgi:aryl-alcohol dehydrogenase-like predicted oxidoreductase
MDFRSLGDTGIRLSLISMGGHEYLPDGRSRGFNEQFDLAVKPGHLFEGFGGDRRQSILGIAYDAGINLFDVTQDSEKEALGRNLRDLPPPYEIYVQTRPEGFVYTYDPFNARMTDYGQLKAEVQRGLKLLRREVVDFLNLGIMRTALDHDPGFLDKLRDNVRRLQQEGLIRWACADTFSGEWTFLEMIRSGAFAAVNMNFNFADHGSTVTVLPVAAQRRLGVFVREAFMKAELFRMCQEAGLEDRARVAAAALRWCLAHGEVTSLTVGTNNPEHLRANLAVLERPTLDDTDLGLIARLRRTPTFAAYEQRKRREWFELGESA